MAKVFISHSSKDKEFVRRLAADFVALGHTPWLDEWEIKVGECIVANIEKGVAEADYVVIVLSQHSVKSGWVEREWKSKYWEEIEKEQTFVLPILINDCEIPQLLKTKRYANFRRNYSVALIELMSAIGPVIQKHSYGSAPSGFDPFANSTQQQVILDATAIQPAFQAICEEAEERLRLFLHVLGPPKITDDLARIIAKRVADRKHKPSPLRFSPVLALNFRATPDWFWPMFDKRNEIYAAHDILELTAGRFFPVVRPSGIDVVVVDRLHVMLMVTKTDGAHGTQTGLVFRNNPSLAAEYIEWFDTVIWANSKTRDKVPKKKRGS